MPKSRIIAEMKKNARAREQIWYVVVRKRTKDEEAGGFDTKSKRAVVVGSGDEKVWFTTMPE